LRYSTARKFNNEAFTSDLVDGQSDLAAGHMFFQLQTSLFSERFDSLIGRLADRTIPFMSRSVEDFNQLHGTTEAALDEMNAHPSCFEERDRIHLRFSRIQSQCADETAFEMAEMLWIQNINSLIAESFSNPVTVRGLEAFQYWRPLTNPDMNGPVEMMSYHLRRHIDEYFRYDYAQMQYLEDRLYNSLGSISSRIQFCNYAVLGQYFTATSRLLAAAADGQC
jgi:hypothetical protein